MAWLEGHRWVAWAAVWVWLTICAAIGAALAHGVTHLFRALRRAA